MMKSLFFVCFFIISIFGHGQSAKSFDNSYCTHKINEALSNLAGETFHSKKWQIQYFDYISGERIQIPKYISQVENNIIYWNLDCSFDEYSYDGLLTNKGFWSLENCGSFTLLSSNLYGSSSPLVFEEISPNFWHGHFQMFYMGKKYIHVRIKGFLTE